MKEPDIENQLLSSKQQTELIRVLEARFENHPHRHPEITWNAVLSKLKAGGSVLWTLHEMEMTGGEPDVVGYDKNMGVYLYFDCSAESPQGRRNICYDRAGQESRKTHVPKDNAIDMAAAMGIELLNEEQYRFLQRLGRFDAKTSSWLKTPSRIRALGGALFGDRRYDQVFIYHNGAGSYYGVRAFRGWVII